MINYDTVQTMLAKEIQILLSLNSKLEPLGLRILSRTRTPSELESVLPMLEELEGEIDGIIEATMGTTRLPEAGDSVVAFPSRSGSVLGSGTGQDEHMPSGREVTIEEMFGQKNPDRSPAPSNVLRLAGGNPEVGGVRRDDICDPPRETEGSNACE